MSEVVKWGLIFPLYGYVEEKRNLNWVLYCLPVVIEEIFTKPLKEPETSWLLAVCQIRSLNRALFSSLSLKI